MYYDDACFVYDHLTRYAPCFTALYIARATDLLAETGQAIPTDVRPETSYLVATRHQGDDGVHLMGDLPADQTALVTLRALPSFHITRRATGRRIVTYRAASLADFVCRVHGHPDRN